MDRFKAAAQLPRDTLEESYVIYPDTPFSGKGLIRERCVSGEIEDEDDDADDYDFKTLLTPTGADT
ncbi:MAG: hypothetical protein JO279_00220 [Verrucomicrobia bacterium]|nr:hypothetical protein [Verrucomicrobiota bacterium]